jgi:uncharacterized glyoxalase superfamily protein PhnB
MIRFEHIAYHVTDSIAAAQWYIDHLDFVLIREVPTDNIRFVADAGKNFMFEFYTRTDAIAKFSPPTSAFTQHLALHVDDLYATRAKLIAAGANADGDVMTMVTGDRACFLRDPFGIVLQLICRAKKML